MRKGEMMSYSEFKAKAEKSLEEFNWKNNPKSILEEILLANGFNEQNSIGFYSRGNVTMVCQNNSEPTVGFLNGEQLVLHYKPETLYTFIGYCFGKVNELKEPKK